MRLWRDSIAQAATNHSEVNRSEGGELFYVPPVPHDNWIIGDEPYVSLHFLGVKKYAKKT
jgi:hypothetical protein